MHFGTERNRKAWEALTPEQQQGVREILARKDPLANRRAAELHDQDAPKARPRPDVAELCAVLKAERERFDMSPTEVARLSGIAPEFVVRLEELKVAIPSVAVLRAFANALGLTLTLTLTLGLAPRTSAVGPEADGR